MSTFLGTGLVYVNGVFGQAGKFDGTNTYIDVGDKVDAMGDSLTLSAWIKTNNYNQYAKIINKGQTGAGTPKDSGYSLRIVPSRYGKSGEYELWFDFIDDNGARAYASLPVSKLPIGKFFLVTGVLNRQGSNSILELYVNGNKVSNNTAKFTSSNTNIPLGIGALHRASFGSTSEIFNGLIDDVRIYNRALSESEIQQLYATTLETNISPKDSGTITKSPDKSSYSPNEEVTLTAKPAKGYKFKQWQGDASGNEATITIKMNGNQNVTAVFEEEEDEKPPIEISSKAIYDSKTKTLSLEGILVPYIDEFTGKETENKGIFDAQLAEKTKLVFELIPWSINFKDMFEGEDTSGYILYHPKTRSVDIPCFEVTTIAQFGDGIEGDAIYYKDVTMKQRHVDYPIFHVEDMTETDSCN